MILDTLNRSAVGRKELSYQQQIQSRRSLWRHPALYGSLALLAAFSVGTGGYALYIGFVDDRAIQLVLALFYVLLTIWHFALMMRTVHLSSLAVTREKRDTERWEALLLTGVSGREIILGKWWATVRSMGQDYLFLACLRAAAAFSISGIGSGIVPFYPSYLSYRLMETNVLNIAFGVVMVLALTLVNLPLTAAAGIMAAMDSKRGSGVARGMAARAAFTTLAALLPLIVWVFVGSNWLWRYGMIPVPDYTEISRFISQFSAILLDNGMSFGGNVIANAYWAQNRPVASMLLTLLALGAYAGLTWGLLRISQWRAERSGALKVIESP